MTASRVSFMGGSYCTLLLDPIQEIYFLQPDGVFGDIVAVLDGPLKGWWTASYGRALSLAQFVPHNQQAAHEIMRNIDNLDPELRLLPDWVDFRLLHGWSR